MSRLYEPGDYTRSYESMRAACEEQWAAILEKRYCIDRLRAQWQHDEAIRQERDLGATERLYLADCRRKYVLAILAGRYDGRLPTDDRDATIRGAVADRQRLIERGILVG